MAGWNRTPGYRTAMQASIEFSGDKLFSSRDANPVHVGLGQGRFARLAAVIDQWSPSDADLGGLRNDSRRRISASREISSGPGELGRAIEGIFVLEDWHNFGADYDRTLMAWHANLEAAWPQLPGGYSDRFRRLWRYYLLTCAGTFRARRNQLWQVALSPRGVRSGYRRIA
jgi:hypothetical protein